MNLAKCPACGGEAEMLYGYVSCSWKACAVDGPINDPDGSKWNALCARLLPPDCVAVPVAELEAVREAHESCCSAASCPINRPLNALLSHLPPKVDHVAVLRTLIDSGRLTGSLGASHIAALEAAIAALEKEKR